MSVYSLSLMEDACRKRLRWELKRMGCFLQWQIFKTVIIFTLVEDRERFDGYSYCDAIAFLIHSSPLFCGAFKRKKKQIFGLQWMEIHSSLKMGLS